MRPILCLSLLLPLTVVAAQQEANPLPPKIELFVGGQFAVDLPGGVKIAVGDSAIVDVKTMGKGRILLVGISEGETTLRVWQWGNKQPSDVRLHVSKAPMKATPEDEQLTLKIGEEKLLTITGITRVAIGDAEIADVKVIGNDTLVLTGGKEVAATTLIIWTTGGARRSILVRVVK